MNRKKINIIIILICITLFCFLVGFKKEKLFSILSGLDTQNITEVDDGTIKEIQDPILSYEEYGFGGEDAQEIIGAGFNEISLDSLRQYIQALIVFYEEDYLKEDIEKKVWISLGIYDQNLYSENRGIHDYITVQKIISLQKLIGTINEGSFSPEENKVLGVIENLLGKFSEYFWVYNDTIFAIDFTSLPENRAKLVRFNKESGELSDTDIILDGNIIGDVDIPTTGDFYVITKDFNTILISYSTSKKASGGIRKYFKINLETENIQEYVNNSLVDTDKDFTDGIGYDEIKESFCFEGGEKYGNEYIKINLGDYNDLYKELADSIIISDIETLTCKRYYFNIDEVFMSSKIFKDYANSLKDDNGLKITEFLDMYEKTISEKYKNKAIKLYELKNHIYSIGGIKLVIENRGDYNFISVN